MGRLRRDTRGNTLAIMAATLVPLAGMVGGGLDASRMYITKTRLQHACDAGALAGRRQMGGGNWDTDDSTAANRFFDANYVAGSFGTNTLTRTYTENAGKVSGTASAKVPMTLMKVLGFTTETLTVTCEAEMRLPNTDVMFVLDNTGSMNEAISGRPGTRLDGLKVAVKCFYQIVAQLDINDVTCATGEPSGGTSDEVQIRFGFMPYSSNVNVGKLLPTSYFADTWNYQSRTRHGTDWAWADWRTVYYDRKQGAGCPNGSTSSQEWRDGEAIRTDDGDRYCRYEYRHTGPQWSYGRKSINVGLLKNGNSWNDTSSFTLPIADNGGDRTITWDGCIEEAKTVQTTDYDPIPTTAHDLNIDLKPTSGTADSLWAPALDQVIYYRNYLTDPDQMRSGTSTSANNYVQVNAACPREARKLREWDTSNDYRDYVNSLVGVGNTYHDIGMLWGARFMSPDGIFGSENKTAASGGEIQRHLIFMTDGDSTSSPCDYNAYGVPWFDQRQSTDVGAANDCFTNRQALIDQIDYRLIALCDAVKAKRITLWVISYGGAVSSADNTRLQNCASAPNAVTATHFFKADNDDKLQKDFAAIANSISQLRLTQ